jgi:hypothetical protein
MEDIGDDTLTNMTLDSLTALPAPCGDEEEDWGYDFLWEDWRSVIDTSYEGWFEDAYNEYLIHVFPEDSYNGEGNGACDYDGVCWTVNDELTEVCIVDYGCFSPDEALDLYFYHGEEEHDLIDWGYGQEFNWDDWRSNFDMS